MKQPHAQGADLRQRDPVPRITKLALVFIFLLGAALTWMGIRGQEAYNQSGFSSETGFQAVHHLASAVEEQWNQALKPALDSLTEEERAAANEAAAMLLREAWEKQVSGGGALAEDALRETDASGRSAFPLLYTTYLVSGPKVSPSARKAILALTGADAPAFRQELLRCLADPEQPVPDPAAELTADLAGTEKQAMLARALVAEPNLLLLDEPLSNLDAKLRETMRFEIKEIQKKLGITVVYVTHDQSEAMAMSDRIFVMNGGVVQQYGTPEDIYDTPANQFVADFLGKVDFFKGEVKEGRILLPSLGNQSIPYTGPRTGRVDVAIRPENCFFSVEGLLEGTLETQYYLGDVDDCRVRVGDSLVRVITSGYAYKTLQTGQAVKIGIRDFMVFPDDGSLEEMLRIQT